MKGLGWSEVILGILVIIFALATGTWVKPALVICGIIVALVGISISSKK